MIAHAAGVREARDRVCTDVVKRLLPGFDLSTFSSAGCADAANHGTVVVYWVSLRPR